MLAKSRHATLIPIKNMNRALKFYTGTLGGSINMRGSGEMKNYWASINIGRSEFWLVGGTKDKGRNLAYNTFTVKNIKNTVKALQGTKLISVVDLTSHISFAPLVLRISGVTFPTLL